MNEELERILMEVMKHNGGDIQNWPAGNERNHTKSRYGRQESPIQNWYTSLLDEIKKCLRCVKNSLRLPVCHLHWFLWAVRFDRNICNAT